MTSKSPLLAVLPEGTVVTAAIERAVEGFESRHTNRIVVAQEQIVQNVGDLLRRSRFESAVADVRRNRWMVPKRYDPVTSVVKDAPLQFDPRGSDSIWRDRAAWCDSKAYEDSDAVDLGRAALDRDGVDVLRRHGQVLGDPRRLRVRAGRRRREGGAAAAVRLRGERHGWRRAQVAVGGVQSSLSTVPERERCGHDAEQAEQQIHELVEVVELAEQRPPGGADSSLCTVHYR